MFLIYINELVTLLNSFGVKVKLFADDVKLYIKIVNGTDYDKLQAALSALCAWTEDWQLPISISKCCVLHIGKGNVSHQFFINGSPLPVVNSCRDLGITIISTLLFSDHITNIVAKAHQRSIGVLFHVILHC